MKNIIYLTLGIILGFSAPSRADNFNLGTDQGVTEDDGSVTVTVTRTGSAPLGAKSIEVSTINGSATGGDDFAPLGGFLVNFPANADPTATTDTRTINIPLINDLDSECEEEFVVRITQATGNSIGGGDLKITIAESDFVILPWDSGITDSPAPGAPSLIERTDQPGVYCYKIVTTNKPLWRTRLTVTSGEAELDLHRGPFSAQDSADYVSGTPGSDGILLHDSQFSPSQEWYLRVRVTEPNTTWSLFSGSVFVHDQGVLASDANYSGPAYDDLPFPPEKALFFTATPPAGAKVWTLWNDGYRSGSPEAFISVRKNQPGMSLVSGKFDFRQAGQMLLVPPYFGTSADTYFITLQGIEGETVDFHSHLIEPETASSSFMIPGVTPTASGAPFRVYEINVPQSFIAWDIVLKNITSGDPNIAVRQGNVGSQWVNDAFSENDSNPDGMGSRINDSITMVPPTLTNGVWYITVYDEGEFSADLSNGTPEFTGALSAIDFLDDDARSDPPILQPGPGAVPGPDATRSGWTFFRTDKISEQSGLLGWDLELLAQKPGTEIAIRQNAVPSRIFRRNATSGTLATANVNSTGVNSYDASSTLGFLQRPSQQADVWYVGVYLRDEALGNYQLQRRELIPNLATPVNNFSDPVVNHLPETWQFYRCDLEDGILGWMTRIMNVTSGNPRLIVRRALLPNELTASSPSQISDFSAGTRVTSSEDFFDRTGGQRYRSLLLGIDDPLETNPATAITYYIGIFNDSPVAANYDFLSEIIDDDSNPYPAFNQLTDLGFNGVSASVTALPAGETKFYRVRIPESRTGWRLRLAETVGAARMSVRRGVIPDYQSYANADADTTHGGIKMARTGDEVYQLLPRGEEAFLEEGDYYIAVTAELSSAFTGVLTSEGEIPIIDLGTPAPLIQHAYSLPADELDLYQFTVPPSALAVEVRLLESSGKVDLSIRNNSLISQPSSSGVGNGSEYGHDGGNSPTTNTDFTYTFQNPAAGIYSITLRAERQSATVPLAASGTLEVRVITSANLSPEGSAAVTSHPPKSWRYFEVTFANNGILGGDATGILAWNTRLKDILGGDPQMVVTKGEAFDFATSPQTRNFGPGDPSEQTSWPAGASWSQNDDFASRSGAHKKSFLAAWEKPLDDGTYFIGIFNNSSTENSSYSLESRTVGEAGSSSAIIVQELDFSTGQISITGLEPRDFSVFRTTTPSGGAASWRTQLTMNGGAEALLSIRRGFVPDFAGGATDGSPGHPDDDVSTSGGGVRVSKNGNECYNLLPEEGLASLAGNDDYFLVVTSEGNNPENSNTIGTGTVDCVVKSEGEIPVETANFAGGLHTRALTLKPAAVRLISFTVPPNSSSLEIALTNEIGNELAFSLREGTLYPEPFQQQNSHREYYGIDGGTRDANFYNSSLVTVAEPAPGTYTLAIRSSAPSPTSWVASSTADLRIEILGPQALAFCGGSASQLNQPPLSWRYYTVTVPNDASFEGWDLGLDRSFQGGRPRIYVRKGELPQLSPSPPSQIRTSPWIDGRQLLATTSDWTGDSTRFSDNASLANSRDLLVFDELLVPGDYVVGVYNADSSEATSYTITSSCVGTNPATANELVQTVVVDGGNVTGSVESREADFYVTTIPANTHRSWQIRLEGTPPAETSLFVNRDYLPHFVGSTSSQADSSGVVKSMQRVGNDVYTLLPDNGSDFLSGGTYYLAVVGRGTNGSYSNAGSGSTPYTLTTELDLAETNMGTMGITGSSLTSTVNLNSSELGIYQFTIPDGSEMGGNPPEVIEVRLDNRIGSGWMTLRSGTRIPSPYTGGSSSYRYGVDQGNSAEKNDEQIITLVNPTPGIYTVTVNARATESTPVDTSADLVIENVGVAPLAFTGATSTPEIPSTSQDTLFDGQKNYYRVEVPEFIELPGELEGETFIQPIIGWKVTLTESSGDGSLRIMETLGEQGGFTTASSDDIAVVVPPLLRPGGVYYIEVRGAGSVDYQITSEVITFYNRWVMPGTYNVEFGDSNATDLAGDDWHFHAIDVPKNNGGLLRTELVALSGNPDLYIREDGVPTINHSVSGGGGAIYDRLLTGNDTEYANWVPLNGRNDIELSPGRWVIGVRAKDANARYRLKVSTGQVQSLNFAALEKAGTPADLNEINDASVLSNDFIYYRVEIPEIPNTPASLSLTFTEDFGDVALHLRDSIPPGNGTRLPASPGSSIDYVIDADDDNKNRWSYWTSTNSGINNPGTTVFNFPELRPGTVYYVGVRGRLDANFDLNIAPSTSLVTDNFGTITNVPFKGIPGGISLTLAAGESRAYRIEVPDGATRFVSNHTHSSEIEARIEQGTLPLPGSSGSQVHRLLSGANTVFNQSVTTTWPWVAGEDYYLLFTNKGAVSETMSFNLAGEGEATRFSGWAASYGLSGMAADADAVNNPRGVSNLSAYAFNIHPVTGRSLGGGWPLPKFVLSGKVNPFPGLEMLIPTTAPNDICYIVEENSQLEGMWIERGVRAGNGSWLGSGFFVEEGVNSNQTRHTVYSARSLNTEPRNFLRIKVQLIAP